MVHKPEPTILYEDEDIVAINKPAGLLVHPDAKKPGEYTLVDWLLKKYPDIKDVGEPMRDEQGREMPRPGIVHRLDFDTTGVLLIAKNNEAFENLKSQFQERIIKKTYVAFVYGEMKKDEGIIDKPIGRSKSDFRKFTAMRGSRGELREAVTEYVVLARGKGVSVVKVMPQTGRTHQIRVHFQYANNPVVGDSLYAPNGPKVLGFKRIALHAYSITYIGPNGKENTIKAPFPEDFLHALKILGLQPDLRGL